MYKKHSLEERLLAVKKCLEGLSPRCVGRQLGINSSYISEWLYKYQREGSKGLEKRPNIRANFEEKCKIMNQDNQIIIYQTDDNQTQIDVRMENDTV